MRRKKTLAKTAIVAVLAILAMQSVMQADWAFACAESEEACEACCPKCAECCTILGGHPDTSTCEYVGGYLCYGAACPDAQGKYNAEVCNTLVQ